MIIKFHNCPDEKFKSILNQIKDLTDWPEIGIVFSKKIIIIYNYLSECLIINILKSNNFFQFQCSIISIFTLLDFDYVDEFNNRIGNKTGERAYKYQLLNPIDGIEYKSILYLGRSVHHRKMQLVLWDLIFSWDDLPLMNDEINFFVKRTIIISDLYRPILYRVFNDPETGAVMNNGVAMEYCPLDQNMLFNGSIIDYIVGFEFNQYGVQGRITNDMVIDGVNFRNIKRKQIGIEDCFYYSIKENLFSNTFLNAGNEFKPISEYVTTFSMPSIAETGYNKINYFNISSDDFLKKINRSILSQESGIEVNGEFLLFIDCETTSIYDPNILPRLVSLSWCITTFDGVLIDVKNVIIKPEGFVIDDFSVKIHGITNQYATTHGMYLNEAEALFRNSMPYGIEAIVGHNVEFDYNVLIEEGFDYLSDNKDIKCIDTMKSASEHIQLFGNKWPKLAELYEYYFGCSPLSVHNSLQDVHTTMSVYFRMVEDGIFLKYKPLNRSVLFGAYTYY